MHCLEHLYGPSLPRISWVDICMSKEKEEYGLQNLKVQNKTLLSKVLWNIQDKQDLLQIKWIHHIYLKHANLWSQKVKCTDSLLIKKLLHIRDEILDRERSAITISNKLAIWFTQAGKWIDKIYEYFRRTKTKQSQVSTVWKLYVQPYRAFIIWLLTHDHQRSFVICKG